MEKECVVCGLVFTKKLNESRRYWSTKKYCSVICADSKNLWSKGHSPWNKGKKYPQITGTLNCKWKGGVTTENEKVRKSFIYKLWSRTVLEKDSWTCQDCGKKGGELNAHHKKPFSVYPELRFAIDNGIALCVPCHRKVDHKKLLLGNSEY